ncbi:hypothetical protein E3T55_18800 [Cryobacterium frigoriphilum]|uniref:Uncharacterized protein n=1 Tax=Cryobacterium frigoriphilum TaxID=1259150 RepID=A0A4R8ZTL3_9MICO|nr:hypothetical protein [Cryobacterium frigoriphilum]TFD45385.1 hypothetical protein E3T55_18800 [Cryobacterium frigoriphilum]
MTLIMLPERDLNVLDQFAHWSQVQQRIAVMATRAAPASVAELGDLAWLRVFDSEDLHTLADELHGALIAGLADQDTDVIVELVSDWRMTARQLEDPLRKAVLLDHFRESDFEDAQAPE